LSRPSGSQDDSQGAPVRECETTTMTCGPDYGRIMSADTHKPLVLRFLDEGVGPGKVEIFDEICAVDLVNLPQLRSAVTVYRPSRM